ncbi:hypothetical protein G4D82_04760 [Flavobacterium sp. CYK-4]|uniref:hypothetical protein n=1 Tax=Flavobacterium lotistagni TaxID=2709660 RepID=UPI00140877B2|nr:hypothetical protein [Flavobacterium lotistagni]NHM06523.1 hypothetical protein [Flavobacterium lotistagni]
MKTYIKKFSHCLLIAGLVLMGACESDDDSSLANQVNADTTSGVILRTITINSGTFDFTNPAAEWSATLEVQGAGNGSGLSEIKLYASFSDSNGTSEEALVKSYSPSILDSGPNGYPRGDFNVSLTEVLTALGMSAGEYTASDKFNLRFEAVTRDGRSFSATNASATVTGGSYLSSPFQYSAQFFCPLADASIFDGSYTVVADAWADYAAGDTVPVQYVASDGPYTFRILSANNPYIANAATSYMLVTINPEDGTATVTSNEDFDYPGFAVLPVTGAGTVGTCTGDINLVLNFGPYEDNTFTLTKN